MTTPKILCLVDLRRYQALLKNSDEKVNDENLPKMKLLTSSHPDAHMDGAGGSSVEVGESSLGKPFPPSRTSLVQNVPLLKTNHSFSPNPPPVVKSLSTKPSEKAEEEGSKKETEEEVKKDGEDGDIFGEDFWKSAILPRNMEKADKLWGFLIDGMHFKKYHGRYVFDSHLVTRRQMTHLMVFAMKKFAKYKPPLAPVLRGIFANVANVADFANNSYFKSPPPLSSTQATAATFTPHVAKKLSSASEKSAVSTQWWKLAL